MSGESNMPATFIPLTDADRALSDLGLYRKLEKLDVYGRIVEIYGIHEEVHLTSQGYLINLPDHIDQLANLPGLPENAWVLLVTGSWTDTSGQSIEVDAWEIDAGFTAASIREKIAEMTRDSEDYDHSWRNEIAMEAGMLGGIGAYNEVLGY